MRTMNIKSSVISVSVLLASAGLATVAAARQQDDQPPTSIKQPPETYKPSRDSDRTNTPGSYRTTRDYRAFQLAPSDWLDDGSVRGINDEKLGDVKDLILSRTAGRIPFVLVGHGGVLTIGERVTAVPLSAMTWDPERKNLTLRMSEEQFKQAPTLDSGEWRTLYDTTRTEPIYSYFHVQDRDMDRGIDHDRGMDRDRNNERDRDINRDRANDRDREINRDRANDRDRDINRDRANDRDREINRDRANDRDREINRDRDGTRLGDRNQPGYRPDEPSKLRPEEHPVLRVSDIRGKSLMGSDGREVGKVNDIVLDTSSGRIAFVAVTFGGVLGIGEEKVAVPWTAFDVNKDGRLFVTTIDKDTIKSAPRLTQKDWGELQEPGFGARVYRHYGRHAGWLEEGSTNGGGMSRSGNLSNYDRMYVNGTTRDLNGTVTSVDEDAPMNGVSSKVTVLTVSCPGSSEPVKVHACPKTYLDQNGVQLRKGDSVVIHGREATLDGRPVVIATKITCADGRALTLRNSDGTGAWQSR